MGKEKEGESGRRVEKMMLDEEEETKRLLYIFSPAESDAPKCYKCKKICCNINKFV